MTRLKAITPDTPPAWAKALTAELAKAATATLNTMKKDFERTTQNWETRVEFRVQKALKVDSSGLRGSVGTDNVIYGYVNNGTKAHLIRPKRARMLRFQTGYRPKTQFRSLVSRSGGAFGAVAFAKSVRHPGTKAREFDTAIADMRQADFEQAVNEAIRKAVNDGTG